VSNTLARGLLIVLGAAAAPACATAPPQSRAEAAAAPVLLHDGTFEVELMRSVAELDRRTRRELADLGLEVVAGSVEATSSQRACDAADGQRLVRIHIERVSRASTRVRVEGLRLSQSRIAALEVFPALARVVIEALAKGA
jgi:hypothetical protein